MSVQAKLRNHLLLKPVFWDRAKHNDLPGEYHVFSFVGCSCQNFLGWTFWLHFNWIDCKVEQ